MLPTRDHAARTFRGSYSARKKVPLYEGRAVRENPFTRDLSGAARAPHKVRPCAQTELCRVHATRAVANFASAPRPCLHLIAFHSRREKHGSPGTSLGLAQRFDSLSSSGDRPVAKLRRG